MARSPPRRRPGVPQATTARPVRVARAASSTMPGMGPEGLQARPKRRPRRRVRTLIEPVNGVRHDDIAAGADRHGHRGDRRRPTPAVLSAGRRRHRARVEAAVRPAEREAYAEASAPGVVASERQPRDRDLTPRAGRHRRRPRRSGTVVKRRQPARPAATRRPCGRTHGQAEANPPRRGVPLGEQALAEERDAPTPEQQRGSDETVGQRPVLDEPPVGRQRREAVHVVRPLTGVGAGPAAQQRGAARPECDRPRPTRPRVAGADRTGLRPRWRGERAPGGSSRHHGTGRPDAATRVSRAPSSWPSHATASRRGATGLRRRAAVRSLGRSVAALSRPKGSPQSAEREGVGVWTGSPRLPERLPRQCCRARPTTGGGLCRDTSRGPAPRGL